MSAAEDNGVDERVLLQEALDVALHEIVGTRTVELVVLHQRYPHRARLSCDDDVGVELGHLELVGAAADGALGGHDTNMACLCAFADHFNGWSDNAEDAACGVAHAGEVALLDAAQCLGGSGVAGEDDQRASGIEEMAHSLQGELIDALEGTGTVGGTCVVAQVEVVVLGHELADFLQNGEAAITAVKDSNGRQAN